MRRAWVWAILLFGVINAVAWLPSAHQAQAHPTPAEILLERLRAESPSRTGAGPYTAPWSNGDTVIGRNTSTTAHLYFPKGTGLDSPLVVDVYETGQSTPIDTFEVPFKAGGAVVITDTAPSNDGMGYMLFRDTAPGDVEAITHVTQSPMGYGAPESWAPASPGVTGSSIVDGLADGDSFLVINPNAFAIDMTSVLFDAGGGFLGSQSVFVEPNSSSLQEVSMPGSQTGHAFLQSFGSATYHVVVVATPRAKSSLQTLLRERRFDQLLPDVFSALFGRSNIYADNVTNSVTSIGITILGANGWLCGGRTSGIAPDRQINVDVSKCPRDFSNATANLSTESNNLTGFTEGGGENDRRAWRRAPEVGITPLVGAQNAAKKLAVAFGAFSNSASAVTYLALNPSTKPAKLVVTVRRGDGAKVARVKTTVKPRATWTFPFPKRAQGSDLFVETKVKGAGAAILTWLRREDASGDVEIYPGVKLR